MLVAGQRLALADLRLSFGLQCANPQLLADRFSVVAIFLTEHHSGGAVPPAYALGPGRADHPLVAFGAGFTTSIDLAAVPAEIARVQVLAYVVGGPGSGSAFRDLGWIEAQADQFRFRIDLASNGDATLHLIDAYRHAGGWRMMANGQGFIGGLGVIGSRIGQHLDSAHGLPDAPRRESRSGASYGDDGHRPVPPPGTSSSGSGFVIAPHHVLTNHHVTDAARTIAVSSERRSSPGRVVFSDPVNDLALVETDTAFEQFAHFRDGIELLLGEDVVLVGYPLQHLLGQGPQVTAGNVSGLCGFANNAAILQYTAPTASGSSGGPILDSAGLVIGVVRAGLAHDQIRNAGSMSENINFGVKGSVARAFLDAAGMPPQVSAGGAARSRAEIAREARQFTACLKIEY